MKTHGSAAGRISTALSSLNFPFDGCSRNIDQRYGGACNDPGADAGGAGTATMLHCAVG